MENWNVQQITAFVVGYRTARAGQTLNQAVLDVSHPHQVGMMMFILDQVYPATCGTVT